MTYTVEKEDAGKRLDVLLSEIADISRSAAAKLIEEGCVLVSSKHESKKYAPKLGEIIDYSMPQLREPEALAENIALDVVYEDSDLIVINKPSGMVVHPAPGNYTGTLVNALLYHARDSLSGIGGVIRPGIVHRIDKQTSGLLVVAKNDETHLALSKELAYHNIVREYHALCRGGFKVKNGTVDAPIGRHPVDRKRMAVLSEGDAGAKHAVTHYELLCDFGDISYIKLRLETGRTHQIRVHMAHIGHALLGDEVYTSTKIRFEKLHAPLFDGQMLHAKALEFTHPRTSEKMRFECPLPANFEKALKILQEQN
jgi:23S rRNA pseudouridine1911/1915/1917 synthase